MTIIICLALWAGKMKNILPCDWLPERAIWSYLAHTGKPAVSRKKSFPESHIIIIIIMIIYLLLRVTNFKITTACC